MGYRGDRTRVLPVHDQGTVGLALARGIRTEGACSPARPQQLPAQALSMAISVADAVIAEAAGQVRRLLGPLSASTIGGGVESRRTLRQVL